MDGLMLLDNAAKTANAANAANAAQGQEPNTWSTVLMFGFWALIIGAMYFILIRPQRKKQKEEEAMRSSIEIGDDVTTIGGIVGRVIAVRDDDETFVLETGSDKTRIRFKKWAVSSIDTPDKQPKTEEKTEKKGLFDRKKKQEAESEE